MACITQITQIHEPPANTRLYCPFSPGSGLQLEPAEAWLFLLLFLIGPLNQKLCVERCGPVLLSMSCLAKREGQITLGVTDVLAGEMATSGLQKGKLEVVLGWK